jgi:putative membrane protein
MTQRGKTVVALAAGFMLSGSAFAQQSSSQRQGQAGQSSGQSDSSSQDAQGRTGADAGSRIGGEAGSSRQGMQADQQIQQQMQQIARQPEQAADKLFVLETAIGNMYEMQLSQQAQQKAQSPEVKRLAQTIMQDHQQASQQLQRVAQQMGVQVPQELPSMKMQEIQILSSLPAEQFEKQYVAKMNELHAKDVTCYGGQMSLAQNDQVKQYVTQTLPKLQQHQQMTLQTAAAMGLANPGEAVQAGSRQGGQSGRSPGAGSSGRGTSGGSASGGASSPDRTNR